MFLLSKKNRGDRSANEAQSVKETSPLWGITALTEANIEVGLSLFKKCTQFLEQNRGFSEEGLFRRAGDEIELTRLQDLTRLEPESFVIAPDTDLHVVATLLKRYFREMREPLLTFQQYPSFIAAEDNEDKEQRYHDFQMILQLLPRHNYRLLQSLMEFLKKFCAFSDVTKMHAANLAIVFTPNILRPEIETPSTLLGDSSHARSIITSMIVDYEVLFGKKTNNESSGANSANLAGSTSSFQSALNQKYVSHTLKRGEQLEALKDIYKFSDGEFESQITQAASRIKLGDIWGLDAMHDNSSTSSFDGPTSPRGEREPRETKERTDSKHETTSSKDSLPETEVTASVETRGQLARRNRIVLGDSHRGSDDFMRTVQDQLFGSQQRRAPDLWSMPRSRNDYRESVVIPEDVLHSNRALTKSRETRAAPRVNNNSNASPNNAPSSALRDSDIAANDLSLDLKGLKMKGCTSDSDASDLGPLEDASSPRGRKPGTSTGGPSYSSNVVRKKVLQSRENLPLFGQFDVPLDNLPKHSSNPVGQLSPRGQEGRKFSLPSESIDVDLSFDSQSQQAHSQRPVSVPTVVSEFRKEMAPHKNSTGSSAGNGTASPLNTNGVPPSPEKTGSGLSQSTEHRNMSRQASTDALTSNNRPVRRPLVKVPPHQQEKLMQQQQQDQLLQQRQQPQREIEDWTTG